VRVLILHNRYRMPGGEERAVSDLQTLLRERGHTVATLERSSAVLSSAVAAKALIGGGSHPEEVAQAVRGIGAEVVHAHNVHPLFGWRALAGARQAGARTVLHLHNFRLFCAIAIGYRDGAPCFRCRGTDTWPGARLRCRGSLPEATAYAVGLRRQQPHLFEYADRFLAVSDATRRRLVELGLPDERSTALANFVPAPGFAAASSAGDGDFALVSGRLVEEKGFDIAIAAARSAGVPLVVAGDGPDAERLRRLATGGEVRFDGRVTEAELALLRARAGVVLAPSRWEEPCPYAVLDALAAGVPVLASDRGGLPELVGRERVLPATDIAAWSEALAALWRERSRRQQIGEMVLDDARQRFSEDRYYERLLHIYER
jgi:glycosyltransferase involved in cell wall biosynthesis